MLHEFNLKKSHIITISSVLTVALFIAIFALFKAHSYQKPYLNFLNRVFREMDKQYYKEVSKQKYEDFVEKYKKNVLEKLEVRNKTIDNVAYIGAGLLVNILKDPSDNFTNFIPPQQASEYSKEIYGYEEGLGIKGHLVEKKYIIDSVDRHSNAYKAGVRAGNVLMGINGLSLEDLTEEQIELFLYPPLGTEVTLQIAVIEDQKIESYKVICEKFYKETAEPLMTGIPGVHLLKIKSFNRETANDVKDYIKAVSPDNINYLILDITNNPGGPPLAVRELCSIFLPPDSRLFYYKKKNRPEFGLSTPSSDIYYKGKLIILVNDKSGSSSELLAGTLQAYNRAMILGKESTAGMAFLKGAVNFEDGSMLTMITGKAFLFNGSEVDTKGVTPDLKIPENISSVDKFVVDQIKIEMLANYMQAKQNN